MKIDNPVIFSASANTDETLLERSISDLNLDIQHHRAFSNRKSLPEVYNEQIEKGIAEGRDCLILIHDDVTLEEDPIPKLEKLFDEFDVVGVAGTSRCKLSSPALWHLMGGGFKSGYLHGCVQHYHEGQKYPSNFGEFPIRVVLIDGVFMAINLKKIGNVRFDEKNPAKFHFYDLIFSMDCALNKKKVGVGDILITHASPGLRSFTEEWKSGENYFFSKYNKFKDTTLQTGKYIVNDGQEFRTEGGIRVT
jgi:hypothetical protein